VGSRFSVFVFSKSKSLYNFHVFTGKFGEAGSRDGTSVYRFVFDLMMNKLIPESFDHTGKADFCDNYFTHISVFRSLLERGIFMTGWSTAVSPKKEGNRKENSWHFQAYKNTDMLLVGGNGWMRHGFQKVQGATGTTICYLHATAWLHNRFWGMLSTYNKTGPFVRPC
jgi:hypothetical protein